MKNNLFSSQNGFTVLAVAGSMFLSGTSFAGEPSRNPTGTRNLGNVENVLFTSQIGYNNRGFNQSIHSYSKLPKLAMEAKARPKQSMILHVDRGFNNGIFSYSVAWPVVFPNLDRVEMSALEPVSVGQSWAAVSAANNDPIGHINRGFNKAIHSYDGCCN
jgi:hypothetical protein